LAAKFKLAFNLKTEGTSHHWHKGHNDREDKIDSWSAVSVVDVVRETASMFNPNSFSNARSTSTPGFLAVSSLSPKKMELAPAKKQSA